jgi:hypothetical protein
MKDLLNRTSKPWISSPRWQNFKKKWIDTRTDEVAVKFVPDERTGKPDVTVNRVVEAGWSKEQITITGNPLEAETYATLRSHGEYKSLIVGRFLEGLFSFAGLLGFLSPFFIEKEKDPVLYAKNIANAVASTTAAITSTVNLANLTVKTKRAVARWFSKTVPAAIEGGSIQIGAGASRVTKMTKALKFCEFIGKGLVIFSAINSLADTLINWSRGHTEATWVNLGNFVLGALSVLFLFVAPIPPLAAVVAVLGLLLTIYEVFFMKDEGETEAEMAFDNSVATCDRLKKQFPQLPLASPT